MKDCSLIRDMLPFYDDKAVSRESRELIEAHLKECPECRKYHNEIRRISYSLDDTQGNGEYRYSEISKVARRNSILTYSMVFVSAACLITSIASGRKRK